MKKDFAELIKDMRIAFAPEFKTICHNTSLTSDQLDLALKELEEKRNQMIIENGYTQSEFDTITNEYFIDFTSSNPDEWIIRHDPENPGLLIKS
ncbi:MAG TPA: hypothetical protein VII94_02005 [Candidatus Saccharimonadales bacterium]